MNHKGDKEYWQLVWDNFKAGDRQAFETIYNEFIDILYAYGAKITTNQALLEDAIQDVFIDVYTYGKKLRHPEYLEFYLFKTLKRNIIRKLKEGRRFDHSDDTSNIFELTFPIEEFVQDEVESDKNLRLLQREIQNLDSKKRELLYLKFSSCLTYTEIGNLLNMKPDTAKKQVQRIMKYFHKQLSNKIIGLFILCYRT